MRMKFKMLLVFAIVLLFLSGTALTCTIIAVGKDATVDGSTIITHNDDSSVADFRLWIIPAMEWPEGSMRDIVITSIMVIILSSKLETREFSWDRFPRWSTPTSIYIPDTPLSTRWEWRWENLRQAAEES